MSSAIIGFYIGLFIGLALHISAFIISLKKKHRLLSWIILINFVISVFWINPFTLIIPIGYLIFVGIGKKIKIKLVD